MPHTRLQQFIRAMIENEAVSDYARLRRLPSTRTWKIITYVSSIGLDQRNLLFDAFAAKSLFLFFPDRDPNLHPFNAKHPEYCRFCDAMPLIFGYEYWGVRLLRSIRNLPLKGANPAFADVPDLIIKKAETVRPTTASGIRKVIERAFGESFGSIGENVGGGYWHYPGSFQGHSFIVDIDYGGRSDQIRYEVSYDNDSQGLHARRLNYESLLGMGTGCWDFVTADNLEQSVSLMCELIRELVAIPDKL